MFVVVSLLGSYNYNAFRFYKHFASTRRFSVFSSVRNDMFVEPEQPFRLLAPWERHVGRSAPTELYRLLFFRFYKHTASTRLRRCDIFFCKNISPLRGHIRLAFPELRSGVFCPRA